MTKTLKTKSGRKIQYKLRRKIKWNRVQTGPDDRIGRRQGQEIIHVKWKKYTPYV